MLTDSKDDIVDPWKLLLSWVVEIAGATGALVDEKLNASKTSEHTYNYREC